MVTMKKIAEICGVSRGTVDRALNGRGRVNAETAEKIRRVAKQMGYEPNPAGKALSARRKQPVIGVVLASKGNPFFDEVLRGIHDAEKRYEIYGLHLEYYPMRGYDVDQQLEILNSIEDKINALIINPINNLHIAEKLQQMINRGIFVVTLNNDIDGLCRHYYVGADYFNGGVTSCALLEALMGESAKIALVIGTHSVLGHHQRYEGFLQRMQRVRDFQVVATIENHDDDILSYELTKRVLQQHPDINAICNLAAGVYGTCRAVMQLPEAKRPLVLGFDTVPTTVEMLKRGIIKATIYQHPYRQGNIAVRTAFEYLVNGQLPKKDKTIMKNDIKLYENL